MDGKTAARLGGRETRARRRMGENGGWSVSNGQTLRGPFSVDSHLESLKYVVYQPTLGAPIRSLGNRNAEISSR